MNTIPPTTEAADSQEDSLSRESLHTLKILDEVATGKHLTQRDLSKKLGIALGMTNNYLKRLAGQGYIQIVQAEKKRLHYLLTPKGIAEKSFLTYRYIKRSYLFFRDAKEKIGRFFSQLQEAGVRQVVLYKVTVITEVAVLVLQNTPLSLVAIVDDEMAGKKFLGQRVQPLKALKDLTFDRVLVTTEEPVKVVAEQLGRFHVAEGAVCALQ